MKTAVLAVLAAVISLPAIVSSPARAQGIEALPPVVQAEIRKADDACRKDGGRPAYEPLQLVRAEDISNDGIEDFFIDYSKYTCRGQGQTFCGSGGCSLQIFLSAGPNRWINAYDDLVQRFALVQLRGRNVAQIETTGIECGKPRAQTCRKRLTGQGTEIREIN
jgi:hypothetical protein